MYNYLLETEMNILLFFSKMHTDFLDTLMVFLTRLGDGGFLWILMSVILLIFKKTRRIGVYVSISLIINFILVNLITKPLVARVRPYEIEKLLKLIIPPPSDYSFPSGHTSASFAFATAFYGHNKKWGIPIIVLASLIAFSRIYLCVHFPSDVLSGVLFGIISSYISKILCDKFISNKIIM